MKIQLRRAQIGRETGLDITVKSSVGNARMLAPTWKAVTGVKKGHMTEEQYTAWYLEKLRQSEQDWLPWLVSVGQVSNNCITFLCYCRDDWFCHTHLLIEYLVNKHPDTFADAR